MKKIFIGENEIHIVSSDDLKKYTAENENIRRPNHLLYFENQKQLRLKIAEIESSSEAAAYFFTGKSTKVLDENFFSLYKLIKAAGGVVSNAEEKVLMMFRRGKWDLPKGKVDFGETIRHAAKREVIEETGVKKLKVICKIKFLNGQQECTYHTYFLNGKRIIKATYWFEMSSDNSTALIPQNEEGITEVGWYSETDIKERLKNSYPLIEWVLHEANK